MTIETMDYDARKQISDLETVRSDLILKFNEMIELDKSYINSFRNNLQKYDELLDQKDKVLVEKVMQIQEELTQFGINIRNLLCKAKTTQEIAQIYSSFKNELGKRSSEVEDMEKEMNKHSRSQDKEYYDTS